MVEYWGFCCFFVIVVHQRLNEPLTFDNSRTLSVENDDLKGHAGSLVDVLGKF